MRVCVTGGSGFIGHKLIFRCLKLGYEVRYLTRSNNCLIENAIAYIGNVNSAAEVLLPFFKDVNIFYHCAGEVNDLANMWSTHVQGTINLLSIIEKSRFSNQAFFHWIQLSSCGAYERVNCPSVERNVNENTSESPNSEYESTKTEADNLIAAFAKKHDWFKYTIIRPTIVFGVGMRSTLIIQVAKMIKKKLFFYIGNKNTIANFVHVDDVVEALILSANQQEAYNQTFIVSNDCKFSDLVDTIADALQVRRPGWVANEFLLRKLVILVGNWIKLPISSARIDVMMRQTYYSNQKIRKALNWSPSAPVIVQLKHYIDAIFNLKNG